jgi:hypothetical protein
MRLLFFSVSNDGSSGDDNSNGGSSDDNSNGGRGDDRSSDDSGSMLTLGGLEVQDLNRTVVLLQ